MSALLLEICIDTAHGLRAAIDNGADRIELCAALSEGGLTPSPGLMSLAARSNTPCRVMIRPRGGDFTYSPDELAVMARDIEAVKASGLAGVVFCVNQPNGELDIPALGALVSQARALDLAVALHRGFDLTPDPIAALDAAIAMQVDTILTSGGEKTAAQGLDGLAALVTRAAGRIEILAGSGVTLQNAAGIMKTGVTAFHASCRQPVHTQVTQKAHDLGYVSDALRDTDGVMVARFRHYLNHLGNSAPNGAETKGMPHVVC